MSTVLYIDHDEDNVLFVLKALEAQGHSVLWATDGREGLSLARAVKPDVILLEMNLPGLDGYEVARRLRADSRHPLFSVPVIALTTNSLPDAALDVLAAGCDVCLIKPVTVRELWAEVADALRQDRWLDLSQPRAGILQAAEV
jgi:two-component system cell cycle response regulator DivK